MLHEMNNILNSIYNIFVSIFHIIHIRLYKFWHILLTLIYFYIYRQGQFTSGIQLLCCINHNKTDGKIYLKTGRDLLTNRMYSGLVSKIRVKFAKDGQRSRRCRVILTSSSVNLTVTLCRLAPAAIMALFIISVFALPASATNHFTQPAGKVNTFAPDTPTFNSIVPNSGSQGQVLTVTISGWYMNDATAVIFSSTSITAGTPVSTQLNQTTCTVTIAGTAAPWARNITVNAFGGTVTCNNCFTVNRAQTPVTVTANVANRSTVNGSTRLTMYVNGQEEASQGITVNSGGNTLVTFTVTRNEPGTYTDYVGGTNAGSFVVDEFSDPNLILFISIAFIAAAFVAGLLLVTRRRQPGQ